MRLNHIITFQLRWLLRLLCSVVLYGQLASHAVASNHHQPTQYLQIHDQQQKSSSDYLIALGYKQQVTISSQYGLFEPVSHLPACARLASSNKPSPSSYYRDAMALLALGLLNAIHHYAKACTKKTRL